MMKNTIRRIVCTDFVAIRVLYAVHDWMIKCVCVCVEVV